MPLTIYIPTYKRESVVQCVESIVNQFTNDIELSPDNVLTFRPLIHIFAGYAKSGNPITKSAFEINPGK